jgi:hypothetical protein
VNRLFADGGVKGERPDRALYADAVCGGNYAIDRYRGGGKKKVVNPENVSVFSAQRRLSADVVDRNDQQHY